MASKKDCFRVLENSIRSGSCPTKGKRKDRVCKTANAEVLCHKNKATYELHGCSIVKVDKKKELLTIDNCGYYTKTSKDHINGVLRAVDVPEHVYQKKGQWFLGNEKFERGMKLKY